MKASYAKERNNDASSCYSLTTGGSIPFVLIEIKNWEALTPEEVHVLFRERVKVFVVEQECPYQEVDGLDPNALHLLGWEQDTLIAYARILPVVSEGRGVSFGRFLVRKESRGKGKGKVLLKSTLEEIYRRWGKVSVRIEAQQHLVPFYQSYGFRERGEAYLLDGILHVEMELKGEGS